MKPWITAAALALAPMAVFAAGGNSSTPPKPTATTTDCAKGTIWDAKTKACVAPGQSSLDDDTRLQAVRELAYAGRYGDADAVLETVTDKTLDLAMTYDGFLKRKMGDWDAALVAYEAAIAANPDNILARSYMGQGYAVAGQDAAARRELREIRARGGAGTWAEAALVEALVKGSQFSY